MSTGSELTYFGNIQPSRQMSGVGIAQARIKGDIRESRSISTVVSLVYAVLLPCERLLAGYRRPAPICPPPLGGGHKCTRLIRRGSGHGTRKSVRTRHEGPRKRRDEQVEAPCSWPRYPAGRLQGDRLEYGVPAQSALRKSTQQSAARPECNTSHGFGPN